MKTETKAICGNCGKPFTIKQGHRMRKFCTTNCKTIFHNMVKIKKACATNDLFTELTGDPEFKELAMALDSQRGL